MTVELDKISLFDKLLYRCLDEGAILRHECVKVIEVTLDSLESGIDSLRPMVRKQVLHELASEGEEGSDVVLDVDHLRQ